MLNGTRTQAFEGRTVAIRKYGNGDTTELVDLKTGDTIVWDNPPRRPYLAKKLEPVTGSVLLCGLGLGTTLGMLLDKEVNHVTVLEINKEILTYVSKFYQDERVRYILADCMKWVPDRDFDWLVDMHERTYITLYKRG